ncbi:MAG: 30S ribosomal protein S3 [Candidatus Bathyarchaeota archaeon]|nr:30S ribosomal protein S3 [Candidatus Bathyarchaeota archaeon]
MSVVRRIIKDSIERVRVDELLMEEYEQAGYGGIQLTKTPLGAQINLFAMRPGRVIGKRGRAIKQASERLEVELGLSNPQITVIEVEVPEMNPQIMASRVANALERGVHFRRAVFWSLNRIMAAGALGCEVILKGPLRSSRSRFEKVVEGYVPKSGDPALRWVHSATMHVKMKRGMLGVTVKIVPPEAKFPDKVNLDSLPEIEYQPPAPVEEPAPVAEAPVEAPTETPAEETVEAEPAIEEAEPLVTGEPEPEVVEEPIVEAEPEAVEEPKDSETVIEEKVEAVSEPEVVEAPVPEPEKLPEPVETKPEKSPEEPSEETKEE